MPPTPDPSRTASKAARGTTVFIGVIVLVGLVGATFLFGWWWIRRSIPPLDGRLPLAGLRAPVDVRFDSFAVPHVFAGSDEDAWRSVGYLQARDRLWQMELYRRAASGRLSELLGDATIAVDQRFLILACAVLLNSNGSASPRRFGARSRAMQPASTRRSMSIAASFHSSISCSVCGRSHGRRSIRWRSESCSPGGWVRTTGPSCCGTSFWLRWAPERPSCSRIRRSGRRRYSGPSQGQGRGVRGQTGDLGVRGSASEHAHDDAHDGRWTIDHGLSPRPRMVVS